jgi:hypothetical protein
MVGRDSMLGGSSALDGHKAIVQLAGAGDPYESARRPERFGFTRRCHLKTSQSLYPIYERPTSYLWRSYALMPKYVLLAG